MKYLTKLAGIVLSCLAVASTMNAQLPWKNGKLEVSAEGRYLKHQNGQPFFWLGDTGWLMPQRLNREEVAFYLDNCSRAGFNVVQVQTLNGVPSMNVYGQYSMTDGFDFSHIDKKGVYGYWDHMDYIIRTAESKGIYIGMVCIWGGLVRSGQMDVEEAKAYGTFLAERYKDNPNIVWIIGGDTRGDVKTEVWETLARTIRSIDKNHLMTFHPFGRTMSATWFNDADWLDFNMFQSGHRRYGQTKGDGDNLADSNDKSITEQQKSMVKASQAITLLLGADNKLYYYEGEPNYKDYTSLKETSYTPDGIRSILLQKNVAAVNKVRALKLQKLDLKISEEEYRKQVSEIKSGKDTPTVIIKATDDASYMNLIDALDEMQICNIGKYVITDIAEADEFLIKNYDAKGELSQNLADK